MITGASDSYEFRGLSTDDKTKITVVSNGSVFFEIDTCKVYMYNAQSQSWVELQ